MPEQQSQCYLYSNLKVGNYQLPHGLLAVGFEELFSDKVRVQITGLFKSEMGSDAGYDGCQPVCRGHPERVIEYDLTLGVWKKMKEKEMTIPLVRGERGEYENVKRIRLNESFFK
ncbi:MAG: hypothetical protein Q7S06_02950 [Nanoarchaeota archaeon]|nr:hypothetical protein [Nanoarchaeota archaeon]